MLSAGGTSGEDCKGAGWADAGAQGGCGCHHQWDHHVALRCCGLQAACWRPGAMLHTLPRHTCDWSRVARSCKVCSGTLCGVLKVYPNMPMPQDNRLLLMSQQLFRMEGCQSHKQGPNWVVSRRGMSYLDPLLRSCHGQSATARHTT